MWFMKASYPRPFWTTSAAVATSRAMLGLASKLCGSAFGLLSTPAMSAAVRLGGRVAADLRLLMVGALGAGTERS